MLRAVISIKDEFYHRHIIQFNLFSPVFDLFRSMPVGSNLISSAILEVSDENARRDADRPGAVERTFASFSLSFPSRFLNPY